MKKISSVILLIGVLFSNMAIADGKLAICPVFKVLNGKTGEVISPVKEAPETLIVRFTESGDIVFRGKIYKVKKDNGTIIFYDAENYKVGVKKEMIKSFMRGGNTIHIMATKNPAYVLKFICADREEMMDIKRKMKF